MGTYIGYYRITESFRQENESRARESGNNSPDERMRAKVIGSRDILPSGMKLLGSYVPVGAQTKTYPGVWIVEADDPADLGVVSNWYAGFMEFEWVPAASVGATSKETEANLDATWARVQQ